MGDFCLSVCPVSERGWEVVLSLVPDFFRSSYWKTCRIVLRKFRIILGKFEKKLRENSGKFLPLCMPSFKERARSGTSRTGLFSEGPLKNIQKEVRKNWGNRKLSSEIFKEWKNCGSWFSALEPRTKNYTFPHKRNLGSQKWERTLSQDEKILALSFTNKKSLYYMKNIIRLIIIKKFPLI